MKIKKISFLLVLLFSFNLFGANSKNISNASKLNVPKRSFLNGPVKTYYKNGKIKSKEYYTGNKKTGIWQYYHENGKIEYEIDKTNFIVNNIDYTDARKALALLKLKMRQDANNK